MDQRGRLKEVQTWPSWSLRAYRPCATTIIINVQVSDGFRNHLPVSIREDYRLTSLLQERQRQRRLVIQVNRKATLEGRKNQPCPIVLVSQKRIVFVLVNSFLSVPD
jgi:hypothetical protein